MSLPCDREYQIRRVEELQDAHKAQVESMHSALKGDVHAMKLDLDDLKDSVNSIRVDLKGMSVILTSFVEKLSERDLQAANVMAQQRESFARVGQRLDLLEASIVEMKLQQAKDDWIGRVVWALLGGAGAVIVKLLSDKI